MRGGILIYVDEQAEILTKKLAKSVLAKFEGESGQQVITMPITASAKKALRQSIKRRARNLTRSDTYKSAVKQLKKIAATSQAEAAKLLPKAYKAIDKAAKTGVIKKNKAARLKSGVARLLVSKK